MRSVPHITNAIQDWIERVAKVPVDESGAEPDIACRCEQPLEDSTIDKIANMCQMERKQVVAVHNVSTTYHVPLLLEKQKLLKTLSELLNLSSIPQPTPRIEQGSRMWRDWVDLAHSQDNLHDTVNIALVGKYTTLHDAYISLSKSFEHAAMYCRKKLKVIWVDASHLEDETLEVSPAEFHKAWHNVCTADGLCVPGGFGTRATLGMMKAITWARTKNVPFLGICLGMQLAVIEYARNVAEIEDAGSEELHPDAKNHAIVYMPEVGSP
ncbi:hypothetical protein EIK77_006862 [Talaromyces pinophilus]|nr:hypothetical protein EIK77_006862 [Talaromyces pinophilus]